MIVGMVKSIAKIMINFYGIYIFLSFSVPALAQVAPKKDNSEKATNQGRVDVDIWGKNLSPQKCKALYNEVEKDLKNANFCKEDSDCRTIELGGPLVEFGCYHFVNKDIDATKIYKKMFTYSQRCSDVIDECSASPLPKCINKKCVYEGSESFSSPSKKEEFK